MRIATNGVVVALLTVLLAGCRQGSAPVTPVTETTVNAEEGEEIITNSFGMKLKLIPAGEFTTGVPEDEEDRQERDGPQHRVRITEPFYLGVHEVTQARTMAGRHAQSSLARHAGCL